ncbi:hypothetical protein BBD42_24685 [Paenibacillus sp. BIHB 4019]|uniref:HAD family hydrolase n=1 Tax=Paenibacillus sp. BIHB 4019 TaxID=1870819 RepID=A0A1B2DNP5_9BACL|nr:HAD family hydrolase [Paenibacillus sp. BIHB 4019]ANY69324.1 hypothetical protein BBD42_24685 [Paenibacillus sp. BIHB 4019]
MKLLDQYDIFIFDFDGTIADTLPLCFESFRQVFGKYNGVLLSDKEIESWFGPSEVGIIKNNLTQQENLGSAIELYYQVYEKEHERLVNKSLSVNAMLNTLLDHKKDVGIVTGKGRRSFDISLNKLELAKYFSFCITGDDVSHPKPDKEGIQKILSYYNTPNIKAVYFGDSNADIEAARNANVASVGVSWFLDNKFYTNPDYISLHPLDLMN